MLSACCVPLKHSLRFAALRAVATPVTTTGINAQSPIPIAVRGLFETVAHDKLLPHNASGILSPMVSPKELWPEYEDNSKSADPSKRAFTYFVLAGSRAIAAVTGRAIVLQCLAQMLPAADVKALASIEVSLGALVEGKTILVKWRGKPAFIRYRTPEEIAHEQAVPLSELRDPQTDEERFPIDHKYAVCIGVCTHLGCVPLAGEGEYGGWFCPCHGSHYDKSGRIRLGPAPKNLEVPPYTIQDDLMVIG